MRCLRALEKDPLDPSLQLRLLAFLQLRLWNHDDSLPPNRSEERAQALWGRLDQCFSIFDPVAQELRLKVLLVPIRSILIHMLELLVVVVVVVVMVVIRSNPILVSRTSIAEHSHQGMRMSITLTMEKVEESDTQSIMTTCRLCCQDLRMRCLGVTLNPIMQPTGNLRL